MEKIVVTGAAGFIGSYLIKALLKVHSPQELVAVDKLDHFQRNCAKKFPPELLKMDPEEWISQLNDKKMLVKHIYHVGACSNTEELRKEIFDKWNVEYSKKLWKLCCEQRIAFLYASSAATYGNGEFGFSDDPAGIPALKPLNPYGWSKQTFDLFVLEEVRRGRTPPVWAGFKYFNVYGPGEDHKASQASVAFHGRQQFLKNGFMKLYGSDRADLADGEQKRDFVYVDDIFQVMNFFASGKGLPGIYNVGTGVARTFNELSCAIAKALGQDHSVQYIPMPEHLKGRYQYFTQAKLENLRAAGFHRPMTELFHGVQCYFDSLSS